MICERATFHRVTPVRLSRFGWVLLLLALGAVALAEKKSRFGGLHRQGIPSSLTGAKCALVVPKPGG